MNDLAVSFPREIAGGNGMYKVVHCPSCGQSSFKVQSCRNLQEGFHITFICHFCQQEMTYVEKERVRK